MTYAPPRPSAPGKGKWRCHYCGRRPNRMNTDHIIPLSRGGTSEPVNLIRSCVDCNTAKSNDLPTCRCEACVAAILFHWEWIAGFRETSRRGLAAQVVGLPTPEDLGRSVGATRASPGGT